MAKSEYQINQRILKLRKALNLTQKEFAAGLKLDTSTIGGIEISHRKVTDRTVKMICLTYGASEQWLKTGAGEMFEVKKDPRLERIVRRFEEMDPLLQDYVVKYLDWLMDWYAAAPHALKGTESPGKKT